MGLILGPHPEPLPILGGVSLLSPRREVGRGTAPPPLGGGWGGVLRASKGNMMNNPENLLCVILAALQT